MIGGRASPGSLTGATAATRYVGATTSGAPATGAFLVGDFAVDQSGQVWICVVAGSPGTWRCATKDRTQLALSARGYIAEAFPFMAYNGVGSATGATGATSAIVGSLIGLHAGDVITGVEAYCTAAGSSVSLFKLGLFSATGTFLAATASLHASLAATAYIGGTLSSPYTITADGGYYLAAIGIASVTAVSLGRVAGGVTAGGTVRNSGARPYMITTAKSDMSADVTPTDATTAFWFACY